MNDFPIDKLTTINLEGLTIEVDTVVMTNKRIRARTEMKLMGHFLYRIIKEYPSKAEFDRLFPEQLGKVTEQLGKTIMHSRPDINKNEPSRFYVGFDKNTGQWVAPAPIGSESDKPVPLTRDYKPL